MDRRTLAYSVAEILLKHLPASVDATAVEAVTAELALLLEGRGAGAEERESHRLLVITSMGRNRPGIVHGISEVLAELQVDIVDMNQTLVRDNFALMIMADPVTSPHDFSAIKERLRQRGQQLGIQVYVQYEDLMRAVNRV